MEWLWTAVEALTAKRTLVVGSIFAGATFFAKYVSDVSWQGHLLFDAPTWAWWVIAVLALLVIFFFLYSHRKRIELVPSVVVSFDQDAQGVVQTPTIIQKLDENGKVTYTQSHGTYVRIRIETGTKGLVTDCVAFVRELEKKDKTKKEFVPIALPDPILLTQKPITIYPNIPTFVPFFQVGVENIPQMPPPWPLTLTGAFNEVTSYLFTISVNAGGVTTDQKVEVNWPGVWDAVTAIPFSRAGT